MGNSHSHTSENGGGGSNSGYNVSSENMIVDLEGRYHIDYKNRNYKKLKPQMFSTFFEHCEIVPADSLINSDFIKNKTVKKSKDNNYNNVSNNNINNNSNNNNNNINNNNNSNNNIINNNSNNNNSNNNTNHSITTSIMITPPRTSLDLTNRNILESSTPNEQQIRLDQEEKENQEIVESSFLKSSPVPSPSSSVSKKFESDFQLNPDLAIETFNENEEKKTQQQNETSQQQPVQPNQQKLKDEDELAKIVNNKSSSTTNIKPILAAAQTSRSTSIPAFNRIKTKELTKPKNKKENNTLRKQSSSSSNIIAPNNISTQSKDGASVVVVAEDSIMSVKSDIKIYSVDLSINRLENITNDILSIMGRFEIQELSLSTNFFQIIPDLQLVKSLTTVNLTRNKLSRLQTSVFIELPSLTSLVLDRNFISSLPDDIDQIRNLKYLSIKHNALETLPNSISNLSQLISLELSQNKLKALPSSFDDLINLRMVWLSNNQITSLPSMKKLVNLVNFDISSNKLLSLPKDFAYLVPSRINNNNYNDDDDDDGNSNECNENINTCNNINNNNCCNKNNILEMINSTELEGGGLGCLRELNIRDNRELISLPVEYKQVESLMTLITSIPSEIIPGVFLGGLDSANNAPILQTLGITHVLLAIGDCEPFFPKTFKYYSIDDARDAPQYDISQHFEQTNCFIEAGRKSGGVLVHCRAGISRSSTLVISYLMKYLRLTFKQAMDIVQSKRPQIQPNPGFKDQLLKYEAKLFCNNILNISSQNNNSNNNRKSISNRKSNIIITINSNTDSSNNSSTSTTPNLSPLSSDSSSSNTSLSKLSISK